MCYSDGQKNKYSLLNECNRMLKYNIEKYFIIRFWKKGVLKTTKFSTDNFLCKGLPKNGVHNGSVQAPTKHVVAEKGRQIMYLSSVSFQILLDVENDSELKRS
jgi:hypothetical protein